MLKNNTFKIALLASTVMLSTNALANELKGNASVTVQNSFDVEETTALTFGSIVAIAPTVDFVSGTDTELYAFYKVSPNGDTVVSEIADSTKGGQIQEIIPGVPAVFTVANAAGGVELELSLPSSPISLKNPTAPNDNGEFKVTEFTATDAFGNDVATAGTFKTDENGAAVISVGATLTIDAAAKDKTFSDGEYVGQYDLTIKYQ